VSTSRAGRTQERVEAPLPDGASDDQALDLARPVEDPLATNFAIQPLDGLITLAATAPKIWTARSTIRPAASEAASLAIAVLPWSGPGEIPRSEGIVYSPYDGTRTGVRPPDSPRRRVLPTAG
jgi:hypothetical protein